MSEPCLICHRVELFKSGQNPYLITEFENSIFVVGDHQFHRGYSLVLLKEHVRELHEVTPSVQEALFRELMIAARAVHATFEPWKMNYSCYGNAEPHVHWHIFPRYESDPDRRRQPWLHSDEFKDHLLMPYQAKSIADKIRTCFAR